ncbi:hypothetical protein Cgig2_032538 [Carnegiea gigantea]|uniref:Jasmonate O-methyltransferase n=1 Tax=Carnegiea gigantea TaxID=171969 RepID=A0A9Q1QPY3_9CARY|nr:hypothetical protein Cgig2_032538 [Carnegiea gigantea]
MVADMGCSSGPNALLVISDIIDIIHDTCRTLNRPVPELGVFLNDLPGNDFKTLFNSLPSFYRRKKRERGCFVSGTPGTFYGRVFPAQFLHFVHSSYSVHWLSQVPKGLTSEKGVALNKKNIFIAETSPSEVSKAHYSQFKEDFTLFLSSRAKELVTGGRMVLTFQGSVNSDDPDSIFELLGSTLYTMVQEGLVEEKKLESFNMPYYVPTVEEILTINQRANVDTGIVRAVTESLLANAFGFGEAAMKDLFIRDRMPGIHPTNTSPPIQSRTTIAKARSVLEESLRELCQALLPECLMVADMGCSSGTNAVLVISEIIDVVDNTCQSLNQRAPELGVFLNDLPGNDFNTLFNSLPKIYRRMEEERGCFVSGTPGSFYGRLFPAQFLHFVHASYSVHWLSQVPKGLTSKKGEPLNKKNIYIAKTSPPDVSKAYHSQFKRDFMLFLRSRAKEMVAGGRMVLTLQGSVKSDDPDSVFELLGSTLHTMVLEGLVEEEKLKSFNMPFYAPTVEEVRQLVEAEGSFSLDIIKRCTVDWSGDTSHQTINNRANLAVKTIRAVTESLLANAFEFGEEAMDDLFIKFKTMVAERMARETTEYLNITVSMIKRA